MNDRLCRVTAGEKEGLYPAGTPFGEIVKDFPSPDGLPAVLVVEDGRLRELHKTVKHDCRLKLITTGDETGHKAYQRSAVLLLLAAVRRAAGFGREARVVLHYSVGSGFYCTLKGDVKLDQAFLDTVRAYMKEMAERHIPIRKRSVNTGEARRVFAEAGMKDKEKLFRYRRASRVNIYSLEDYEDYFYGFMLWHTGYLKYFDLRLYDEGFILLLPEKEQPDEIPAFAPSEKVFRIQQESEKWGERMGIDGVGDLNECISRGQIGQMMLVAEALQESRIAEIAADISARPEIKFVMIAGPSSSGKTTFSKRLAVQLSARGMRPRTVSLDNYYLNREDSPRDENGNYDFECLEALDIPLFSRQMKTLLEGGAVQLPTFNFHTGKREYRGEQLQMGREDILVLEGIHGLNDQLSGMLPAECKYKIYISALTQLNIDEHNRIPTTDGRLIRRIIRDYLTRSTSARETIAMWPSVRRGEERYIFPFQEQADVMFNSALIYELAVLKLYAEPLLFQVPEEAPEYPEAKRLLKFLDYFIGFPSETVPQNSILREFIGGGCF